MAEKYPYGYYLIEPITGLIYEYEEKFQVNILLDNLTYFDLEKPVYFPLFKEVRTYKISNASAH